LSTMSVDVDAVNERLNGLVTLLQAVGVDSLDKSDLDRVSKGIGKNSGGGLGGAIPDARQLNDEQIEAIIRKLQQAQEEAPQIIAALQSHSESRSLASGERKEKGSSSKSRAGKSVSKPSRAQIAQQKQQQLEEEEEEEESSESSEEEEEEEAEEEEEEDDDDDDDDDSEEYDEDGNYPMVGPGCSDDCSVMSDLTTPTVVSGVTIPEEEHYRDTLPPMMIGGGSGPSMMVSAPKRKNLVSQVGKPGQIGPPRRATAAAPSGPGGAAASRRKNYQSTMAKLQDEPAKGYQSRTENRAAPAPMQKQKSERGPSRPSSGAAAPTRQMAPKSPGVKSTGPRPAPGRSSSGEAAPTRRPASGGAAPTRAKSGDAEKPRRPASGAAPSSRPAAGTAPPKKRVPKKSADTENFSDMAAATSKSTDWASGGDDGWGGFDSKPAPKSQGKSAQTNIDDDGFLVGDGFDPFASAAGGSNPFKSSAGDLEGPPRKSMSSSSSTGPRKVRPKKPEEGKTQSSRPSGSGTGNVVRKTRPAGSGSGAGASSGDKPRRSRRASVV
jgi:hypothetical protein